MEGWIKLHRQLQDNKFWTCEPFTRGQAWIDLILLANHKYGFFYKRGNKVEVQRGQVGVSEKGLSLRWQWSRSKVRKFLNDLEKEQQIEQQKSNVTQIVTVINYDKYQEKEPQKDTKRTAEEPQKDTNKNNKEEKKKKEEDIIKEQCSKFVDFCNENIKINGKERKWTVTNKTLSQFGQRIKRFNSSDFAKAIEKAKSDNFHKENNYKYLTPEYFTREEILNRYANL